MPKPRFRTLWAVAVCVGTAWTSTVRAQDAPQPLPEVFGEVLDVRVVNLEVVVTDKDGVVVRGLGPEDFRLVVDGVDTPIDFFTEVRGGVAADASTTGGTDLADVPAITPGESVPTSYLLFIDDYFSLKADRDVVLDALEEDLPLIGPADRMAVVAFDGRDLEMLSTWSQSTTDLQRALRRARARDTFGLQRLSERRQLELASNIGSVGGSLSMEEQAFALRLADQVDRSIRAATATLRSFAKPPGRKVLLLLSGGWPYLISDYTRGDVPILNRDNDLVEGERLYRPLVDAANLLGYTVYPVAVPGNFDRLVDEQVTGGQGALTRRQELRASLHFLAGETGGQPIFGGGRRQAFRTAVEDTRSYYWLGFSPQRAWDDRRHDVEIEAVNPALRVRSRTNFLDISNASEVTMAVESALLFESVPESPSLSVSAGSSRKGGFRKKLVPLRVTFPLREVTFLDLAGIQVAEPELRIAVYDEGMHLANVPIIPMRIELEGEPDGDQTWTFETEVKLRSRKHRMMVAIHDPPSGRILTASLDIDP